MLRIATLLVAAASTFALGVAGAGAAPGDLDRSFSGNGIATLDLGSGRNPAHAVAVQPNGRIVAAGEGLRIARFRSDGAPDSSFGDGGVASIDLGAGRSDARLEDLAIQQDGRIVVAGYWWNDNTNADEVVVARLMPSGEIDPSFGSGGVAETDVFPDGDSEAYAVALQGSSIVVGGAASGPGTVGLYGDGFVTRLDENGDLDPQFGEGGTKSIAFPQYPYGAEVRDLAIDGRGRIVTAGFAESPKGDEWADLAIARLRRSGRYDRSFSSDGRKTVDVLTLAEGFGIVARPNGDLAIAGEATNGGSWPRVTRVVVAAVEEGGPLDHRFGGDGVTLTRLKDDAFSEAIALQADGKVLVAAMRRTGDPSHGNQCSRFGVMRYTRSGKLDDSFSENGKAFTKAGCGWAHDLTMQRNGRILVAGHAWHGRFMVARYKNHGRPAGG